MAEPLARRLSLEEARAWRDAIQCPVKPGTLHPDYLVADATRDPALESWFIGCEAGDHRWLHGIHVTRIGASGLLDASSPYGYGGPLASTQDEPFLSGAWAAYATFMRGEKVVVEYVRFHPLLGNERGYPGRVSPNREVVSMDLSRGDFETAYPPRLRQTLGKSRKAGVAYREAAFSAHADAFGAFHRAAMREMGADAFYHFDDAYFQAIGRSEGARIGWCVDAMGQWLAAALFLDGKGVREYHLAATTPEGRKAGAPSLLLHEAALAASGAGLSHLYLGGGTDASPDNPLLFFKAGFSPVRLAYRTGSAVFDEGAYDRVKAMFPAAWRAHPERPIFHRKV